MIELATAGLADQVELLKITHEPLSNEELSKLWTAFQAKYRPSAGYRVSLVLIQSEGSFRSALPVLSRNVYALAVLGSWRSVYDVFDFYILSRLR